MSRGPKPGPPAARLALRVGVTGHRPEGMAGADLPLLGERVRAVLSHVARIAREEHAKAAAWYSPEKPLLTVVSPLAEGADRIVAEAGIELSLDPGFARDLDFALESPLPFARAEYATDFEHGDDEQATRASRAEFERLLGKARSVLELDGERDHQEDAYEAVGRTVVRHCDVLIALWDGEPARGKGGTGQIVREAVRVEVPVVWISIVPPHDRWLLAFERDMPVKGEYRELEERLRALLRLPVDRDVPLELPSSRPHKEQRTAKRALGEYLRERQPRWTLGFLFGYFNKLLLLGWSPPACPQEVLHPEGTGAAPPAGTEATTGGARPEERRSLLDWLPGRVPDFKLSTADEWKKSWTAAIFPQEAQARIDGQILEHYAWADKLANYYGGKYRSSFVANYLLSGLAVAAAFAAFVLAPHDFALPFAFTLVELVFIVAILFITRWGRRAYFHERWMDYRLLAEQLRQMRFLLPLGRTTPTARLPIYLHGDPRNTWVSWHFRAVVRATPLIHCALVPSFLEACRRLLAEATRDQVRYHFNNEKRSEELAHRLHGGGLFLFLLTLAACVVHAAHLLAEHLAGVGGEGMAHDLTLFGAMVLPAFGAALAGISTQAELERIAKRSRAMTAELQSRLKKLVPAAPPASATAPTPPLSSRDLGQLGEQIAETMVTELLDWRVVFQAKPLELPG